MMSALRRLAAYWVDWCLFAMWGMAVFAGVYYAQDGEFAWTDNPWKSQAFGALLTTLPFALYFVLCERSARGATVGKRVLFLRVTTTAGKRLSLGTAALRTAIKLLPWELGHTAAHQMLTADLAKREPPEWAFALSIAALVLATIAVAMLFVAGGRTLHDRIAGTIVARNLTGSTR